MKSRRMSALSFLYPAKAIRVNGVGLDTKSSVKGNGMHGLSQTLQWHQGGKVEGLI
jgi:hypothetical protein